METSVIKFTADSMRELTNQSQQSLEKKEFKNAKDKIIAAAQQGKCSLNLTLEYPVTIKSLQTLGFKIKTVNHITNFTSSGEDYHTYYQVSWEEENK